MNADRRRSPRIELLGQLHGRVVPYDVAVTVRNVSLGGVSLESPFPFPVGALHEFRLMLGDDSTVRLRGTILRCDAQRAADGSTYFVTGVRFLEDVPDDDGDDSSPGISGLLGRLE